jgi:hypothetical protein
MRLPPFAAAGLFLIVASGFSRGQSVVLCCTPTAIGPCSQSTRGETHPSPVPVERGGKWGYADRNGKLVIGPRFENARKFSGGLAAVYVRTGAKSRAGLDDSDAAAAEERKWGFIDETGKTVIAPEFEAVADFSEGFAAVSYKAPSSDTDTWGYVDREGHVVIKPQFSAADPFTEGLALVWAGGVNPTDPVVKSFVKMGYIDKAGHWAIGSRYRYFFYNSFSEGVVPFRKNGGKWGYMNQKGEVVIKTQFDWSGNFSQGSAPALIAGACVHIDKAGHRVVQPPRQSPSTGQKSPEQDRRGIYTFPPTTPPCS